MIVFLVLLLVAHGVATQDRYRCPEGFERAVIDFSRVPVGYAPDKSAISSCIKDYSFWSRCHGGTTTPDHLYVVDTAQVPRNKRLGSPNEECPSGGPGSGAGGEPGSAFENCNYLGKVLVPTKSGPGDDWLELCREPSDIWFRLKRSTKIVSVTVLDSTWIDDGDRPMPKLKLELGGNLVYQEALPLTGENGVGTLDVNGVSADYLKFWIGDGIGIVNFVVCKAKDGGDDEDDEDDDDKCKKDQDCEDAFSGATCAFRCVNKKCVNEDNHLNCGDDNPCTSDRCLFDKCVSSPRNAGFECAGADKCKGLCDGNGWCECPPPSTTVAPTTAAPPTTVAPTTTEPPTTVAPTTAEPPTTVAPTTAEPTTTEPPSTTALPECTSDIDCDDKNDCTLNLCVEQKCVQRNVADDTACDTGRDDPCIRGACWAGTCEKIQDNTLPGCGPDPTPEPTPPPCKRDKDCKPFFPGATCAYKCVAGWCEAADNDSLCDDKIDCTHETCVNDQCAPALRPIGFACNDGTLPHPSDKTKCDGKCDDDGTCICAVPECTLDTQCDDANDCTVDQCLNNKCHNFNIQSPVACALTDPAPCTVGKCTPTGECAVHPDNTSPGCVATPAPPPRECHADADCDDDNPCTTDVCLDAGQCRNYALANDSPCESGEDAAEAGVCQDLRCWEGTCTPRDIPGCTPPTEPPQECWNDAGCASGNECKIDICVHYKCVSRDRRDGCECDDKDDDECTEGKCKAGACLSERVCEPPATTLAPKPTTPPQVEKCWEDADCDDKNPCTVDTCVSRKAGGNYCLNKPATSPLDCELAEGQEGCDDDCVTGKCLRGHCEPVYNPHLPHCDDNDDEYDSSSSSSSSSSSVSSSSSSSSSSGGGDWNTDEIVCGNGIVEKGEECDGELSDSIFQRCGDKCKFVPRVFRNVILVVLIFAVLCCCLCMGVTRHDTKTRDSRVSNRKSSSKRK